MAKHLCDSKLVFLVDGLTQVHQASILDIKKNIWKINSLTENSSKNGHCYLWIWCTKFIFIYDIGRTIPQHLGRVCAGSERARLVSAVSDSPGYPCEHSEVPAPPLPVLRSIPASALFRALTSAASTSPVPAAHPELCCNDKGLLNKHQTHLFWFYSPEFFISQTWLVCIFPNIPLLLSNKAGPIWCI